MDDIVYVERKGGKVLLMAGHKYYKVRQYKSGNVYWRCANKKKKSCNGSLTLTRNETIVSQHEHSELCQPNPVENEITVSVYNLKKQVQILDQPIPQLYNNTLCNYKNNTFDILSKFPSYSNIKHSLYDARNQAAGTSKTVFRNVEEVEVPLKFKDFFLADYYFEGTRVLVFCSLEARCMMSTLKEFFGDGTFKCCPAPFTQLFSIYGEYGSTSIQTNVVPLVYALLSDKKQSTYFALFEILRSTLEWNPQIFHCDFEVAILNSIQTFSPSTKVVGCYYHWSQCIWRKAKALGLSKTKSKCDRRIISLCSVLPLLPSDKILCGWDYIKGESKEGTLKVIKYIERHWIKNNFDFSKLISVFSERHRTNNILEGSHANLNRIINTKNVTLLRVLSALEKHTALAKIVVNRPREMRRKWIIQNDDYIRDIQLQLVTGVIAVGHALDKLR